MTDSTILPGSHRARDAQAAIAAGESSPTTDDHPEHGTQVSTVVGGGTPLPDGHLRRDAHQRHAAGDLSPTTDDQSGLDAQATSVVGGGTHSDQPPASESSTPTSGTPGGWSELRLWAEMFDDAQRHRIAQENRVRSGMVDGDIFAHHIDQLRHTEHQIRLDLVRCYRRVTPEPVRAWAKLTRGVGEPLLARLLGHLGHPAIAVPLTYELEPDGDPYRRTVGQLWQYCGHGAPARKRKGMTADEAKGLGSPRLKMLTHLIAEAIVKSGVRTDKDTGQREGISALGQVYVDQRKLALDKVHQVPCVRCGPSGKPAAEGTPWNPGHQHAHALRIVGKEFLRDLWEAAS